MEDRDKGQPTEDGGSMTGEELKGYEKELVRLRRHLHQHPEFSMQEVETSRFIEEYLKQLGIPCRIVGETGVIGTLYRNQKTQQSCERPRMIAVRAEIDALPVTEETGLPFASADEGKMNACGHDAITADVLCLAKVLAEHREEMKYDVRFLFEPAEETGEGARYLIANGALKQPEPEAVLVFHYGNQETRAMEIQKSVSTAAVGGIRIHIKGKASHWSQRREGVDAIYASSRLVCAIHEINENFQTQHPFVLGFGLLHAGKSGNIMADEAELTGSLRAFTEQDFAAVFEKLQQSASFVEQETGVSIRIELTKKIPPIINDPALVLKGERIGREMFGEKYYSGEVPFLVGDNAAFYMEKIPGMRAVFLAGKEGEEAYPVHHSRFDIDESVMMDALEFLVRFVTEE